jgi:ubiquinol-cytochrome c reductase core subunit 2
LGEISTQQVFRPWEIEENIPRLRIELASRPPQQRAIDLLHKAAYRTGLGNSIYISKSNLGKIDSEAMQHYMCSNFKTGRCAVVGTGIDHQTLSTWASQLALTDGTGETKPSPYKGGEIRSDKGGDLAFVAIAGESAGFTNTKDALAFCVLKYALGAPPSVKYGQSSGILPKAVGGGNYGITAMNITYSDSGLFGVLAAADSKDAGKVVQTCIDVLKNPQLKDSDVKKGINCKRMEILSTCEGPDALEFMGTHALYTGKVPKCGDILQAVESITVNDVQAVARKLASGKLSIAAVGNLKSVPFLDELC